MTYYGRWLYKFEEAIRQGGDGFLNLCEVKYAKGDYALTIAEAFVETGVGLPQKREKRYYTCQEVCKLLHIGTTTFYRLVNKGKLTILKLEGRTLVDADELDKTIETHSVYRYRR